MFTSSLLPYTARIHRETMNNLPTIVKQSYSLGSSIDIPFTSSYGLFAR